MERAGLEAGRVATGTTHIVEQRFTALDGRIVIVPLRGYTQQRYVRDQFVQVVIAKIRAARTAIMLSTAAVWIGQNGGRHPHIGVQRRGDLVLNADFARLPAETPQTSFTRFGVQYAVRPTGDRSEERRVGKEGGLQWEAQT